MYTKKGAKNSDKSVIQIFEYIYIYIYMNKYIFVTSCKARNCVALLFRGFTESLYCCLNSDLFRVRARFGQFNFPFFHNN